MDGKAGSAKIGVMWWLAVVVSMVVVVGGSWMKGVEAACPSAGQLGGACGRYAAGPNPPLPPFGGGCCSILRSAGPACLCSVVPRNLPPKIRDNFRRGCGIGISCAAV